MQRTPFLFVGEYMTAMREFRLIKKSAQISTKVKGLGSPLRAEPSGRCCRRHGHIYNSILFVRTECKGDTTRGKRKLKQGQKTAFPFPLMVSPLQTSSLNPYSLPFFIPLHFACRRRPNPVHLFALFSIAMFAGLGFVPFFYLLFLG